VIDLSTYLLFLATAAALVLAPGPAQALVLSRTFAGGRRAGVLTAVGLNLGTLSHAAAAALGLSALLATSALAFTAVKLAGSAYLILLGLAALRGGANRAASAHGAASSAPAALGQAVATGVLNPKVALFFLAFLPQFVDPAHGPLLGQFLLLGGSMAALDVVYECALVWLVARTRERWLASPRLRSWQERFSGGVLVALGLRLAVQQR